MKPLRRTYCHSDRVFLACGSADRVSVKALCKFPLPGKCISDNRIKVIPLGPPRERREDLLVVRYKRVGVARPTRFDPAFDLEVGHSIHAVQHLHH